ncbi:MAG: glycosyltransferase family 39 protein, partial [Anaerolineales bacterium]
MKKSIWLKLTFFEDEQAETGRESWKIKITGPLGISITLLAEKMPIEEEIAATPGEKSSAAQFGPLHNIQEAASAKWEGFTAWCSSIPGWLRKTGTAKKDRVVTWFKSPQNALFSICILIYLLIRLIGLTNYPVYFSFDEANPTILASDFLRDGFHNYAGDLFPPFFQNINNYSLGTTVYIQLAPLLIFGRSDYVIRLTSVLVGLIGAMCVSLALRDIFRARYWWAGILVLSVIPAWFHHSRTAYEMVTFVSFYSAMLYCYWLYRLRNPAYLYAAVPFAALAFYAYAPGQALVPLTILVLFILDFPYHVRKGAFGIGGAEIGAVLFYPYVSFQVKHFSDTTGYLHNLESYWVQNLPLTEKISIFLGRYLFHLNPVYWFAPAYDVTPADGVLHIMKGYGHLGFLLLPFLAWGLWLLARRLRQPEYRVLLAALLIAPVGASLVLSPSSITRALVMVIPAALIASIGLDDLLGKLADRFYPNRSMLVPVALLVVLLSVNTYMLWDVLNNGTSWFDANVVQFGASKVFPALKAELKAAPNAHAVISPNWMMNGDVVARLYMGDNANISFNSTYDYAQRMLPLE